MTFDEIIAEMKVLFEILEVSGIFTRENVRKLPQKGIYVFYEGQKPIYVGRSRNIPSRVLNHGRQSAGHNSATFAFLLAKERARSLGLEIKLTRSALEKDPQFSQLYAEQKRRVAKMDIKAVEIKDPEVQAIFEIYASKELKTPYNDFDTH
jgi:predicted GIY-YIG superfamily endonuclease